MKKYIILDFGKVLAYPTTGDWFITPLFLKLIDISKINKRKLLKVMKSYSYIISKRAVTLEDEYNIFYEFYYNVFNTLNYKVTSDIIHLLAYDFAYNDDKYRFYEGVNEELDLLASNYKLLLLSDNWPSAFDIMKNKGLDKYFEKLYISSVYAEVKKDGLFFDYPIKDFNIKEGEAIFIDDNEKLLDVAVTKGLDVRLMDRDRINTSSKYTVINNLEQVNEYKKSYTLIK